MNVRAEKVDKKNVKVPWFLPELWPIIVQKLVFLQFCAVPSKKPQYFEAIYIYVSERSHYALLRNGTVNYAMTHCFGYIRFWYQRISWNFGRFSIVFDLLMGNISWTVSQTTITQITFWKNVMITLRYIYVNCLGFLLWSAQNCKRLTFFNNERTISL